MTEDEYEQKRIALDEFYSKISEPDTILKTFNNSDDAKSYCSFLWHTGKGHFNVYEKSPFLYAVAKTDGKDENLKKQGFYLAYNGYWL